NLKGGNIIYKIIKLENNLRIVVEEMPYMKSVAIVFGIGAGSRYEVQKHQGISHLIEHMLFKGTNKRKSTLEISQAIEGIGGEINASTSKETTYLYAKVPQEQFKTAFNVLADIILNSLMREEDLHKEKNIIIEEIKKYQDIPEELVEILLDKIMWKNHPLGKPIFGDEKSVINIQREDLLSYINIFYRPNNLVISVAGNIKIEEVILQVDKYFKIIEKGEVKNYLPAKDNQKNTQIGIKFKKSNQTHLSFGFPGISRLDPDKYSVDLLDIILGSGLSSRLFQKIRVRKSLAYDIHSSIQYFNDISSFNIYAGIDSNKLGETIQTILEELNKIKDNNLKEGELRKAKEMYKGALSLSLESTLSRAFWLGNRMLLYGRTSTFDEIKEKIEEVKVKDIQKMAQNIFTKDKVNLSIVGPFKEKDKEEYNSLLQKL
ncbi:MAG: insulinase family protein, partial [Candidatus Atribacteria bacterium]|nr:insulinase family protein [Candidatus Atribacteria bacterium]MBE3093110.1 insulinase family protein [Chloroflexota bacterium]